MGDLSIFSLKKIFGIVIISSVIGLIINYFNPTGIPLLREKQELKWASDSLFIEPSVDDSVISVDSNNSSINTANKEEQQAIIQDSLEIIKKNTKSGNGQSHNFNEKETKKKSESIAFEEPKAIKLEQAYSLFNKGILFIDARDESDYNAGHITNSINIPFDDLDNHKQKLELISKEKPLVIYCAGTECDLSHLLANYLFENGYKQVYVFFGGWVEWIDAKYPIEQSTQ